MSLIEIELTPVFASLSADMEQYMLKTVLRNMKEFNDGNLTIENQTNLTVDHISPSLLSSIHFFS